VHKKHENFARNVIAGKQTMGLKISTLTDKVHENDTKQIYNKNEKKNTDKEIF